MSEFRGCILEISEYGDDKKVYKDKNYENFIKESLRLIEDHLRKHGRQGPHGTNEVKNINIHLYTQ